MVETPEVALPQPHSALPTLSVVIPAHNEAALLPGLVTRLQCQTRPPAEIVVADAQSDDGTGAVARALGCIVVAGGTPGAGRNAGAAAASGDVLLFLDADVFPPADFTGRAVDAFLASGAGVGGCLIEPLERSATWGAAFQLANAVTTLSSQSWPHTSGACIFATREVHARLGGFDERPLLAEDHDYARRAHALGEFTVLRSVRIPVSTRGAHGSTTVRLMAANAWAEANLVFGRRLPLPDSKTDSRVRRWVAARFS